jgi:hypothetical protein
MSKDWTALVRAQGDIAKQMADRVVKALSLPDLSSDQLNRLYCLAVEGSQEYEAFLDEMSEYDVPDELDNAADAVDDIWSKKRCTSSDVKRCGSKCRPVKKVREILALCRNRRPVAATNSLPTKSPLTEHN